jgi:hypothetical protein
MAHSPVPERILGRQSNIPACAARSRAARAMMAWGLFRHAIRGFDNFHTMHRQLFADQIVCAFEIANRQRKQRTG